MLKKKKERKKRNSHDVPQVGNFGKSFPPRVNVVPIKKFHTMYIFLVKFAQYLREGEAGGRYLQGPLVPLVLKEVSSDSGGWGADGSGRPRPNPISCHRDGTHRPDGGRLVAGSQTPLPAAPSHWKPQRAFVNCLQKMASNPMSRDGIKIREAEAGRGLEAGVRQPVRPRGPVVPITAQDDLMPRVWPRILKIPAAHQWKGSGVREPGGVQTCFVLFQQSAPGRHGGRRGNDQLPASCTTDWQTDLQHMEETIRTQAPPTTKRGHKFP